MCPRNASKTRAAAEAIAAVANGFQGPLAIEVGFAKLYDRKTSIIAADLLNDRVVSFSALNFLGHGT